MRYTTVFSDTSVTGVNAYFCPLCNGVSLEADNGGIVMVNFYPGFINCSSTASLDQVAGEIYSVFNVVYM